MPEVTCDSSADARHGAGGAWSSGAGVISIPAHHDRRKDPYDMKRTHLLGIAGVCIAIAGALPAQTLSAVSAIDGTTTGPFFRSEVVILSGSGFEPLRPVTIFSGQAGPPLPVPGVTGFLGVTSSSIQLFGPYDGLGILGGSFPLSTDAIGAFSFTIQIPTNFGAPGPLPSGFVLQAIALQNPFAFPATNPFVFSSALSIVVDEPTTGPSITGVSPQFVAEGSPTPITILGTGFLTRVSVVPEVRFESVCNPGIFGIATSVQLIDNDPSPALVPALLVTPPAFIGGQTVAPFTNVGLLRISVRYSSTPIYVNNPSLGDTTTNPVGFSDPTYFVMQSNVTPVVTSITPAAGLTTPACPLTITGSGFLNCSQVLFDAGTPGEAQATGVNVISDSLIVCQPPPNPQSSVEVAVRNPDHFPASPRQSGAVPNVTTFTYFNFLPTSLAVTQVQPPTIVEGSGPTIMTITVACPHIGNYTALDPRSGSTSITLGSNINGIDASVSLAVTGIVVTAPGVVEIQTIAPAFPPGLNPVGPTQGGFSNTGVKHIQLIGPLCLDPSQTPHAAFSAIPSQKPSNRVVYLAASAPTLTGVGPNNCGRVDGNQSISIFGTGFFTQSSTLPESNLPVVPIVEFVSATAFPGPVPFPNVTILSDTQLVATTPDLSGLGLPLPVTIEVRVTNQDGQSTSTLTNIDDFSLYPSLASPLPNVFALAPGPIVLDTGSVASPQIFTFDATTTIPLGQLINAAGERPLVIRCRGDLIIDGTIDLSGSTITTGPYGRPAGAGTGGIGANALNLGLQGPFVSENGQSPIDSSFDAGTLAFPVSFGGSHGSPNGAGGGGGGFIVPGQTGLGLGGGLGGKAYILAPLRIPVLAGGTLGEFLDPPGGAGGAAGGLGTTVPFTPPVPPASVGFGGSGGNGGGSICLCSDGVIILNGVLRADGQSGGPGLPAGVPPDNGGGGGGGAGGAILLQSIQGIVITATATCSALGGPGGVGGTPTANDGGAGSVGAIRFSIPTLSSNPGTALNIAPGASLIPSPDTTGF